MGDGAPARSRQIDYRFSQTNIACCSFEFLERYRQITERTIDYCKRAIELFDESFEDDTNLYQDEALQFVSEAMAIIGAGFEFSTSLIWKDQLGEEHTIDIAGRFKNYENRCHYSENNQTLA